jgi:UrcA family protein
MKRNYPMRRSIVTVLAALVFTGAVSGVAAPAAAETAAAAPITTLSVSVDFGDLDVATPAGAAALDKRIEAAASDVCQKPDIRQLKQMAAWEECKAAAKTSALERISILEPYENLALASVF